MKLLFEIPTTVFYFSFVHFFFMTSRTNEPFVVMNVNSNKVFFGTVYAQVELKISSSNKKKFLSFIEATKTFH